jgi:hypothetical protein
MMDGHVLPKCFGKGWVSNSQQRRKYKMELLNGTHHSSMSISLKDVYFFGRIYRHVNIYGIIPTYVMQCPTPNNTFEVFQKIF